MTEPYVIRIQYMKNDRRHSQFFEINADSREEAQSLLNRIHLIGKVCGTRDEMDEMAKCGRPPNDEEMVWARKRADELGLL